MIRTACICAVFLSALVLLSGAAVYEDIPGFDKTTSPDARKVLQQIAEHKKDAPKTIHMKLQGKVLDHDVNVEVWIGGLDVVSKVEFGDGKTIVEGEIDKTMFKVHDGESEPMRTRQKVGLLLHAHPIEVLDVMIKRAKKIGFDHGSAYGKKLNVLVLHDVLPLGDIEFRFYQDGTLEGYVMPMHHGLARAVSFGKYSDIGGNDHHSFYHEVNTWIVRLDKGGSWSTEHESSRHLSRLSVTDVVLNKPVPSEIFSLEHWVPKDDKDSEK